MREGEHRRDDLISQITIKSSDLMEPPLKKYKRPPTDFSIRSLIDSSSTHDPHSSSHTSSPTKSTSNESLQYSPSSSSTGTTPGHHPILNRLSWLPDAEIIDKARKRTFVVPSTASLTIVSLQATTNYLASTRRSALCVNTNRIVNLVHLSLPRNC